MEDILSLDARTEIIRRRKEAEEAAEILGPRYQSRLMGLYDDFQIRGGKRFKVISLPPLSSRSSVTPLRKEKNDNIIQEFIAYKFYEKISPYYFKTRLVDIEFTEIKKKKTEVHKLIGFLIEDDKRVADRFEGKSFERYIHPKAMDDLTSVQNSFFQFMIGNTDFSVAYQHNGKLLYVNKKIHPLPYDFDLCGLVDACLLYTSDAADE